MLFHPKSFLKPFFFYAPDDGGGGGGDDKEKEKGGGGGGTGDDDKKSDEKKFSQKDLDALVGEARKSGRETAIKTLLTELGIETPDALKSFVKNAKELEQAQMTEADKQKAALEAAQKAATDAQADKDKAIATANERLMKAAVMSEASKAEHKLNPAAMADLWLFVDKAKLEVTETGDVKGTEAAVKLVLKDRPYLQTNGQARGMPLREGVRGPAGAGGAERKRTVTKL